MNSTKHVWHQEDREDVITLARRRVLMTLAAVEAMSHIADGSLDDLRHKMVFYQRALAPLQAAISQARTLLDAYDYFLARCQEGGITLE
jgi:hypothetical protein